MTPALRTSISLLLLLGVLAGCGSPTPEERVRARIDRAVEAARAGDVSALSGMVSRDYRDEEGRDRRTLLALVALELRRSGSLHFVTRVGRVEAVTPDHVEAELLVAVARGPDLGAEDPFASLDGDVLRVRLVFVEEGGDWNVGRATWSRPLGR